MSKFVITTLCLAVLAAPCHAGTENSKKVVDALVRKTVGKVLVVVKDKNLSRKDKREKVMKIIEPVVDFPLMAKLSLGRKHWPKTKPKQRQAFTKLLVETLKASYFEKIDLFSDEVVEFKAPVAKKTKFYALTYVLSKGERLEVAYKLYKKKGAWKVYDFEIEGVSIVKSYGSQYNEFLREGKFDALLVKMRKKIEAAKKKEAEKEKGNRKGKEKIEAKEKPEGKEKSN